MIDIFSIIFITFFFLKEQGLFVSFLLAIVPAEYENQVKSAVEDSSRMLTRYFGGVVAQIFVITVVVSIGLTIFGIENALLIAFFAALINVIPYVGPIIGATFGVFVVLTSNLDPTQFYSVTLPLILKVVAVFGAMQMLDNFLLQPFIFSWMQYDPKEEIVKLEMPALIISGDKDLQVDISEAEILKDSKPESEYLIIKNMNHIFKKINGGSLENSKSYNQYNLPVMPELIDAIKKFID